MTNALEEFPELGSLTVEELALLLRLARASMDAAVTGDRLPVPEFSAYPPRLVERRGCFVTLRQSGTLRGCIGNVRARDPLCRMIVENARSAALDDPRFSPVTSAELSELVVEVSVLTEPRPLTGLSADELLTRLTPRRDGVLLQIGGRVATFLPQVWEMLPDPRVFLDRLAQKAGCAPDAWRTPSASVQIYQAQHLDEVQAGGMRPA